jgi:hypothetical protein
VLRDALAAPLGFAPDPGEQLRLLPGSERFELNRFAVLCDPLVKLGPPVKSRIAENDLGPRRQVLEQADHRRLIFAGYLRCADHYQLIPAEQ